MIREAALSVLLIAGITCSASGQADLALPSLLGSVTAKQANGQAASGLAGPASSQLGKLGGLVDEDVLTYGFAQPLAVAYPAVGSGAAGGGRGAAGRRRGSAVRPSSGRACRSPRACPLREQR